MKKAKAHGIGVHSQEEIIEFGKNDMRVLSDLLSDKPFFFGDEPTLVSTVRILVFFQDQSKQHANVEICVSTFVDYFPLCILMD